MGTRVENLLREMRGVWFCRNLSSSVSDQSMFSEDLVQGDYSSPHVNSEAVVLNLKHLKSKYCIPGYIFKY